MDDAREAANRLAASARPRAAIDALILRAAVIRLPLRQTLLLMLGGIALYVGVAVNHRSERDLGA